MNVSLYQASAAMSANMRWQETVAENLASSSIPGYKRQDAIFSGVQTGALVPGMNAERASLPRAETTTSFSQGSIRATGVKTDVAIEGEGFFEIQLQGGRTGYTRDGEFRINAEGQLTTKRGEPVLGDGGPIQVDVRKGDPVEIASTGEVSQGEDVLGRLRLVKFSQPEQLESIGGGCYIAANPTTVAEEVTRPSMRQGSLEGANTSPVTEMASLITVMRLNEANQKMIQLQDERMGRVISELGNPAT